MSFAELFDAARIWASTNLPMAVGGFVAAAVLSFLCLNAALRRRRGYSPARRAAVASGTSAVTNEKALSWEPAGQSYADRRGAVRREGQPVRVVLAATTFRNGVCDGYVIDRSTGGLKVATQAAIAPGSTLQIRAVDAPDTVGFVTLLVRSCRKADEYYEIGCEFEKTPPWNVLLLFG